MLAAASDSTCAPPRSLPPQATLAAAQVGFEQGKREAPAALEQAERAAVDLGTRAAETVGEERPGCSPFLLLRLPTAPPAVRPWPLPGLSSPC